MYANLNAPSMGSRSQSLMESHAMLSIEVLCSLLVYVDDLVLAGNDLRKITQVKALLDVKFKIKDLSHLKYFLGFEIARSKEGIMLYQQKYATDLLEQFGLTNLKYATNSMRYTFHLSKSSSSPFHDLTPYHRLIRRLLYLTNTRPDISFTVN
ncbi:uncharacterized mitochondrial protein AtMg00810-like [Arachis stenosperma]|uniref:uncharacterized mitochondrial protein AtMg00810-like n=1 Tax=Arachis stenosperma TaxID=217475 RepID=UPI0025ACD12C|nr:uncharacterized mitochondrial protein AtMg00810-like [Arachis stenosperma]